MFGIGLPAFNSCGEVVGVLAGNRLILVTSIRTLERLTHFSLLIIVIFFKKLCYIKHGIFIMLKCKQGMEFEH